jgi:hypothetical protein
MVSYEVRPQAEKGFDREAGRGKTSARKSSTDGIEGQKMRSPWGVRSGGSPRAVFARHCVGEPLEGKIAVSRGAVGFNNLTVRVDGNRVLI